jgi:hypothetical protein
LVCDISSVPGGPNRVITLLNAPIILARAILSCLFITSDARHSRRAIGSNTIDGVNIQILQRGENAGRCFYFSNRTATDIAIEALSVSKLEEKQRSMDLFIYFTRVCRVEKLTIFLNFGRK